MTAQEKLRLILEKAGFYASTPGIDNHDLAGPVIEALAERQMLDDDPPADDQEAEQIREWRFRAWLNRLFPNARRKAERALRKFKQGAPNVDITPVYEVDFAKLEESELIMNSYNALRPADKDAIEAKISPTQVLTGAQRLRLYRLRKSFPNRILERLLSVLMAICVIVVCQWVAAVPGITSSRRESQESIGQLCSQTCSEEHKQNA